MTDLSNLGEKNLVERLRKRLTQGGERKGIVVDIGDDTAALQIAGRDQLLLFTCDMLVENTHFRRAWPAFTPEKLGWKALAVNISDIAAMGGRPTFALVSVALPGATPVEFVDGLYAGLEKCAREYGVTLAGGDSVGSPQGVVIDVSLIGEVAPDKILRRSGAQPGNALAVTGPLGGSAAGLQLLEKGDLSKEGADELIAKHLSPQPRLAAGQALAASGALSAMMDLSDGLADDLPRLCAQSGVGAQVLAELLPAHHACYASGLDAMQCALCGGEDYELLFSFPPQETRAVISALKSAGAGPPLIIGDILPAEDGLRLIQPDGQAAPLPEGFRHFG